MTEFTFENIENLRVINTVYNKDIMVEYKERGRVCLRRAVRKDPQYVTKRLKVKNRTTGEITDIPESREVPVKYTCEFLTYPKIEWETLREYLHYPRPKPKGIIVGFYVLPNDPIVGERLFIKEILEDYFVTEFWSDVYLAGNGFAIWNGKDLEIDTSEFETVLLVG